MTESSQDFTDRQQEIVTIITRDGFYPLEKLAHYFSVSTQSIRRDVVFLDSVGAIKRFHGGAGPIKQSGRSHYNLKQNEAVKAKQQIAEKACTLLQPDDVIFIDVGTTTEWFARALIGLKIPLTVFTNSIPVSALLAGNEWITLYTLGGFTRSLDGAIIGAEPQQKLETLRLKWAFIAFSGFDPDGALTDFDLEKIAVKQTAIKRSEQSIALGDHRKFTRNALGKIADLKDFSIIITDALPPEIFARWQAATKFIETEPK